MLKVCNKCGEEFPSTLKYFFKNKGGLNSQCKDCRNKHQKEWRGKNKERCKEYNKKRRLKINFNMSLEAYNNLLEKQNHCCAICKKHENDNKRDLAVDHNHKTGKVRGLLCINCNRLIGYSKDNIETLENAIRYLKELNF